MLYEFHHYTAHPGKLEALKARFGNITVKYFERHGIRPVGFFTNVVGGRSDEFVYILQWDDLAHRERSWGAFTRDQEWHAARLATEVDGPLVHHTWNRLMAATEYSPVLT